MFAYKALLVAWHYEKTRNRDEIKPGHTREEWGGYGLPGLWLRWCGHTAYRHSLTLNVSIMVKRLASAANRHGEGGRLDAQGSVLSENVVDIGVGELLKNRPLPDRDPGATYKTV